MTNEEIEAWILTLGAEPEPFRPGQWRLQLAEHDVVYISHAMSSFSWMASRYTDRVFNGNTQACTEPRLDEFQRQLTNLMQGD